MDSEVGKLDIVINANADRVAQEVDKANAKLDQLAARAQASSQRMVSANKSTVDSLTGIASGLQRTAGSIDDLGAKTDELLGKQHTAWLAIGAVVGGATQQMIQKVIGFVDRLNAMPAAIDAGFKPLIQSQMLANDTMQLSNATLEKQIAIIEKKPVNGAAVAFAESEIAVDHLASSLDAMNSAMDKVLSDNHIARWKILFGKGSTSGAEGTIRSFDSDLSDITYQEQADQHDNLPESAAADERERRSKLDNAHSTYQRMIGENQDSPGHDNSAIRRDLQSADALILGQIREYQEADQNKADKARLDQDEAAQRAKQNAAEAAAAQAKEQAERYKTFQLQRDQMRQVGLTPKKEFDLLSASDAADTPQGQARLGELAMQGAGRAQETIARYTEQQKQRSAENSMGQLETMRAIADVTKLEDDAIESQANHLAEMNSILEENTDKLKEQQIGFDLARGAITKHDAAVQLASVHQSEFAAKLDLLNQQDEADAANPSLTPDQRNQRARDRNQQRARIGGEMALTSASDQNAIQSTTVLGATTDALNEFAASALDASSKIKDFVDSSLSSFNDQVIQSFTHRTTRHETDVAFRNLGAGIFRNAAGKGLGALEGMGLSALHLGGKKAGPSGNPGDPMYVAFEGDLPGMSDSSPLGMSGFNSLLSRIFRGGAGAHAGAITSGAVSDAGDFAASDAFSGGASALSDIIPFFGDGGAFSANTLAIVGEKGPELVNFGRAGNVISNANVSDALGGSGNVTHNWHIDARNSPDPAAVRASAKQGAMEGHAAMVGPISSLVMAKIVDTKRRLPTIKRMF